MRSPHGAAATSREIAGVRLSDDRAVLREQMTARTFPLRIVINDDVALDITIDPTKSPYSSGSFPFMK
ncbi:hypothetical protein ACFS3C_18560 [Azotobacter vinelandii]|uniref:hypothetical protein n=1 Tax=Azotobacter vinelandii TaxID=354 RepID=UPI001C31C1B1|nr:hypothetical protein [Azotobacter vinelandii]GLK61022.1 hypothetical protein GCM10017624_31850 [Azotobacter vinelandii]